MAGATAKHGGLISQQPNSSIKSLEFIYFIRPINMVRRIVIHKHNQVNVTLSVFVPIHKQSYSQQDYQKITNADLIRTNIKGVTFL